MKHEYAASGANAGKPQFQGNMARATSTVKYDPATEVYTVRDTGSTAITASFGPSQRTSTNADFNAYARSASGTAETFKVSNLGATMTGVPLTYVQYGHWRRIKPGGGNFGNTAQNDTYLAFGTKTARGDVPTTGSANYTTYLDGTYVNSTTSYDVDGTGTMAVNFASGTLSSSATLSGTPSAGSGIAFGTLSGSGIDQFRPIELHFDREQRDLHHEHQRVLLRTRRGRSGRRVQLARAFGGERQRRDGRDRHAPAVIWAP